MNATEFQSWIKEYYQARGWSELDIFIRIGFLSEETGEVARAIRALEIGRDRPDEDTGTSDELKQELIEELGDVLGNVIVIANKYDIAIEDFFNSTVKSCKNVMKKIINNALGRFNLSSRCERGNRNFSGPNNSCRFKIKLHRDSVQSK